MLILVGGIVQGETYDCTCTTTALGTAQLRSCQANAPQVFQESGLRIHVVQQHLRAIQIESDSIIIV